MCRGKGFINNIKESDILVYNTNLGFYGKNERHCRLIAILRVTQIFEGQNSHDEVAKYFTNQGKEIPANCIPQSSSKFTTKPKEKGCGILANKYTYNQTEKGYRERARKIPKYIICEYIYSEFNDPIELYKNDFEYILSKELKNKSPNNSNGKLLTSEQYKRLLKILDNRRE
ncbi:hypothetical protein [Staphylococcus warneri]|uniref:hypothetical protein n=1 Tax=Staphylococcus warneri TaxID=1292 RepID=UPI0029297AC0|nr:hypothetical protein [Staphylococcus warneri]MDU9351968.1 hypothetical protein [Staphylococcus warneri]